MKEAKKGLTPEQKQREIDEFMNEFKDCHFVIANEVKFGRDGKVFNPVMKKVVAEKKVVEKELAIIFNSQWENSGKFYEVDYQATREFKKKLTADIEARREAERIATSGSRMLAEAVKDLAETRTRKPRKEKEAVQPIEPTEPTND